MNHTQHPIDEYTLAAYIAGTLSEGERAEVAAYLAENADARELLQMAYEALEAARHGDPHLKPVRESECEPSARRDRAPKRPVRSREVRFPNAARYAATALLITVGLGVWQVLTSQDGVTPIVDAYRDAAPNSNLDVSITSTLADLRFAWSAIPSADRYRVVVWDLESAAMVGRYLIPEAQFDRSSPGMAELKSRLEAGHLYTIRVDAIDKRNRLVRSSESIEFTPSK